MRALGDPCTCLQVGSGSGVLESGGSGCTVSECSGAFHSVKPSDMLAELQGRLPIRVELQALT
jgi:hypothetical protein